MEKSKTVKMYNSDIYILDELRLQLSQSLGRVITRIEAIHLLLIEAKKCISNSHGQIQSLPAERT